MSRLLSDRAEKTSHVVVLPAALDDPSKPVPGLYRIGLVAICFSILVFFAGLVLAYYVRSSHRPYWTPIQLPQALWVSTALIVGASVTFEVARNVFRRGMWRIASRLLVVTACLGAGFLASQLTAWRELMDQGVFLAQNPHSSFFYLFTGLHAAHLLGGLIALSVVLLAKSKRRELVDVVAYYWHFLALLWIALFLILRSR
ncbi:MAG TPA: cytochrome c oxidase subunit 3 [Bryobacteraceae bacterium]|nr:cytochrome c oxidase subunit 3 [Bryobacteraceae bacterium]